MGRANGNLMIVRFLKNPHAAHADHLTCVLPSGKSWESPLPRAGVLPLLATRYVIESTLGWTIGWFGSVAKQGEPDDTTLQARQSQTLADLLQSEQWGGASSPEIFRQKLAASCAGANLSTPALSDEKLSTLRTALRTFGAAWRPLNVGEMHEVNW